MGWEKTGETRDGVPVRRWITPKAERLVTEAYFANLLSEPSAPGVGLRLSPDLSKIETYQLDSSEGEAIDEK